MRLSPRQRKRARRLTLAILAGMTLLLQAAIGGGLVDGFLFPAPLEIAASFPRLVRDEGLVHRCLLSGAETLLAIGIGTLLGGTIGWILHRSAAAWIAFRGAIAGLNAAPLLLLYPLFLLLFGRGTPTLVAVGVLASLPPIILKTREAFAGVSPILVAVGRSLNLGRWQQVRLIELPAAAPTMVAGIRLGLFYALTSIIGAEFLTGMGGLGALIPDLADRYQMPAMYAAMLVVVLTSTLLIALLRRIETWLRAG